MKTRILLVLFIIISCTTYSQDSSFRLKDYKYRTPGFRLLSINIDFRGNIDSRKLPQGSTNERQEIFQLSPSTLRYYSTSSTDKRLKSESYHISPSLSFTRNETDLNKIRSTNHQTYFSASHNNRFYKTREWFFELNNHLNGSFYGTRVTDTASAIKRNELQLQDILSIGYGKGRIEAVQDAQMALFILNDLDQNGLLNGAASPGLTKRLAILITEINNKRIFDNRRRRIYELTQLESFLRENGITTNTDIRHFTILNDNWAFANNPIRQSGSAWFIRLRGVGERKNYRSDTEASTSSQSLSRETSIGVGPQIGYENYRPVNLHWQRDFNTSISWKYYGKNNFQKWVQPGSSNEYEYKNYESGLNYLISYGLSYYPNTRTIISGTAAMEGIKYRFDVNSSMKEEFGIKSKLSLSADYFIGYRTRFNAGIFVNYDKWYNVTRLGVKNNYHYLNSYFSAGLIHTIF